MREQFLQDALAAWDDYQAGGLHTTGRKLTPGWKNLKRERVPTLLDATDEDWGPFRSDPNLVDNFTYDAGLLPSLP